MLTTLLGPRETIEWFEQVDRQHEILCFMITADPKHRLILANLAQSYIDADAALGSKVAFILFGGGDANRYPQVDFRDGHRTFLPGEPLQPRALRDYHRRVYFGTSCKDEKRTNLEGLDMYETRFLADRTASVAAEWMKLMGVKRGSLPVLCALVKGSDPAVISLGDKFDISMVLKLFGRLADIAERDAEKALLFTFDAEVRMKRALALGRQIEELERSFQTLMEAMCNRFKATSEEKKVLAEFLARKPYSSEALDRALADCKFAALEGFNSNTTVKGARNKLNKIAKALADLEECQLGADLAVSLSQALDAINNRRQETARLVRELSERGFDAKTVEKQSLGVAYDKYATRANQALTLLEKLGKLVGLAKGAELIAQILK